MDLTEFIAPTSDQLDAVDLLSGPRTFTITKVSKGSSEQPVEIALAEFPRPWRPGKSMRRVLVACWGADASAYVGRRVRLYCDPNVRFGSEVVGGTRIEALSHISKAQKVPLLVSRGKSAMFTVQPLPDEPAPKPPSDGITGDQLTALFAALKDNDLTDRDDALAHMSKVIGRQVGSTKELTRDEAAKVIASLPTPPAAEDGAA